MRQEIRFDRSVTFINEILSISDVSNWLAFGLTHLGMKYTGFICNKARSKIGLRLFVRYGYLKWSQIEAHLQNFIFVLDKILCDVDRFPPIFSKSSIVFRIHLSTSFHLDTLIIGLAVASLPKLSMPRRVLVVWPPLFHMKLKQLTNFEKQHSYSSWLASPKFLSQGFWRKLWALRCKIRKLISRDCSICTCLDFYCNQVSFWGFETTCN